MTFVEFFDSDPIRNVSSALLYTPERVLLVGKYKNILERVVGRYQRVFDERGQQVIFEVKATDKHTVQGFVDLMTEIVETYDDLVFDVDGGDQLMMVAFGIVYERYRDKHIRLHQLNPQLLRERDCDEDGEQFQATSPKLSVEDVIRLHGGDIVYSDVHGEDTYVWDMTPDFCNDIDMMWSRCSCDTKRWNIQIGVFEAAKEIGHTSEDGLTVSASLMSVELWIDQKGWKFIIDSELIRYLEQHELITDFKMDAYTMTITFKDLQVKRCLTKSGLIFELRVFSFVRSLKEADGHAMYDDAVNGVVIDWDGVFHDEQTEHIFDTENEIDIVLTRGITPIFISCKSGRVEVDELYKLHTVARRFGGSGVKMVLAAATVENDYLRQRMRDMGIYLIEDVHEMDDTRMAKKFGKLWTKTVSDGIQKKNG